MKASRWRTAFFVAIGLNVIVGALLGYAIIDQAVTISYMSQGYDQTKKDLIVLAAAFPLDRYNKKDIVAILRRKNPDAFIVETRCSVQLDGIRFDFKSSGVLSSIETRAQYSGESECDN